ncbi:MAG: DUF6786 family protein [Verrucomicrobiota bacterium]
MKSFHRSVTLAAAIVLAAGTRAATASPTHPPTMNSTYTKGQYGFDLQFLQQHLKPVELSNGDARVLIAPEYQGRVMTSSASGGNGFSFGWINRPLIESGKPQPHINAYGGEERLWFGPEGGQFSIFFAKDAAFDLAHWQTPACLDTEAFQTDAADARTASFSKHAKLTNYSGFTFEVAVTRKISLLSPAEIAAKLDLELPAGLHMVAYETDNRVQNTGKLPWAKETGALSIWLLGMMNPSPEVTVVIPYQKGDLGTILKDDYFGKVPADRLKISEAAVFFKADGKCRSKIGIPPKRALPTFGSYDAANKVLTIVETTLDPSTTDFVNSAWEIQQDPFSGDVINSYNDGPLADGTQMGPFYELESSSKAGFLQPGETLRHVQRTFHFEGDAAALTQIAGKKLGVSLADIQAVFATK